MRFHGLIAGFSLLGCAQGEPFAIGVPGPNGWVEESGADTGEPAELPMPEAFAWSVAVEAGSTHRLLADDGATVLAASRSGVTVTRFEVDATRTWSAAVPQIFGGAPVEVGRARRGQTVVVGSSIDGRGLAIVALSSSGAPRWTGELVPEWGMFEARGVAVHESGAVAVVAEEFADARPVRTVVAFLDAGGLHVAREAFTQPRDAARVVADTSGFAVVGHAAPSEYYPHNTWIRRYAPEGILVDAEIIGVGLTGAWTRESGIENYAEAWIGGVVDESLSCLLPAFGVPDVDMKESPTENPLAMDADDAVLAIESDLVALYPSLSEPRTYAPSVGIPTHIAVGPQPDDPIFALSTDESTATHELHLLER